MKGVGQYLFREILGNTQMETCITEPRRRWKRIDDWVKRISLLLLHQNKVSKPEP